MSQPIQTRENHIRRDPWFLFVMLAALVLFLWSGVVHFQHKTIESFFISIGFLLLLFTTARTRIYSLKVQDRVIRLEERMRLQTLGSDALRARIAELTESQLIALRFASDAEVPTLAMQALDQKLDSKQIKAAIQNWRGDYWRI